MKKAAICIDDWKLPAFADELTKAGYTFEEHPGILPGTLTLTVYTETVERLAPVVLTAFQRAKAEKRRLRPPSTKPNGE